MALALPIAARQALRAADARHDAERDLGLAEPRSVGGDDDVAHHGELAAAAEAVAGDGGDERLAHLRHAGGRRRLIARESLDEGKGRHLLDVGAGGEGLLRAGDDDRADIGIRLEGVERGKQLADRAASLSALSASGRLRVIRPTRPRVSRRMFSSAIRCSSALADGTIEGRAAGMHLAPDDAAAAGTEARLALAVIDREANAGNRRARRRCACGRGATSRRRRWPRAAPRGSARRAAPAIAVGAPLFRRERAGGAVGRQPGPPQRLADIDVAEARRSAADP